MRPSPSRVKRFVLNTQILVILLAAPGLSSRSPTSMADTAFAEVREALRIRLEQSGSPPILTVGDERVHASETTARFYERRSFIPAWLSGREVSHVADELLAALGRAGEEGLNPAHYHVGIIGDRLQAMRAVLASGRSLRPGEVVDLELLLTDGFILYGSHLLSGHVNPETIDPEWFAARRGGDMATSLEQALSKGRVSATLRALAPPQPGYARLKAALSKYRQYKSWVPIDEGLPLRIGDRSPRVAALRDRLAATGDVSSGAVEPTDHELFDDDLDHAVRRFQTRHGMEADGIVGKDTVSELNRPLEERIQQIVVNLERWRWLPQELGGRHVLVNIAGFDVRAVKGDGEFTLNMRAIVGRTYRRTPVFSDQISYLVLNPSWTIPPSIAVQDKLPLIRKDTSYLNRQNIRVFSGWGADARELDPTSIDWSSVGAKGFPFRLRQDPGVSNALGAMKFMFPNKHNVYLHDTPARELFAKSTRDFSSGCIRIERPLDLAVFLLEQDQGWSVERIKAALATQQEQTVRLGQPVPVHIQYWTAWVDEDGLVSFRKDLYSRDDRVSVALRQAPPGN